VLTHNIHAYVKTGKTLYHKRYNSKSMRLIALDVNTFSLLAASYVALFKDTFDWAVNNPEYGIPAAIIGAPVALAATPMLVSYALFPFASGASYLMPELSSEQ
jgi:hypothetical protein